MSARKRWSDREVMQLHLASRRTDIFITTLAVLMERTPRAVKQKAHALGLYIPFEPPRHIHALTDEEIAAHLALQREIELAKAEAPFAQPYKFKWA